MVHSYLPANFSEQRHCVFPGFARIPYQEASIFVLEIVMRHQPILIQTRQSCNVLYVSHCV